MRKPIIYKKKNYYTNSSSRHVTLFGHLIKKASFWKIFSYEIEKIISFLFLCKTRSKMSEPSPTKLSAENSFIDKFTKEFKSYHTKISWVVFLLICIFAWSGWIEVFGLYKKIHYLYSS